MQTNVHVTVWGPREGSALADMASWREQEAAVSARVQRALSQRTPVALAQSVCVAMDCRTYGEERLIGYVVTVVVAVPYQVSTPAAAFALECQMESLVGVALLGLICPIDVERVEAVWRADDVNSATASA